MAGGYNMGDLYPNWGRMTTNDITSPDPDEQAKFANSDQPSPPMVSGISKYNIWSAVLVILALIVLFHL